MIKKETTIDDLARMIANGFSGMDARFDSIEVRLDALERDVEVLKRDVSDIKLRLDNVAYSFDVRDLEKRVTRLEHKALVG